MKIALKAVASRIPWLGPAAQTVWIRARHLTMRFDGSADYWERHYRAGRTSGAGSYGRLARFKAEVVNAYIREHEVKSVVELGCGDGHQLSLAEYPHYVGFDVSESAIALCKQRFDRDSRKQFHRYEPAAATDVRDRFRADLALSLDVIYHLVEAEVFEAYMQQLFALADQHVIIYSSNHDGPTIYKHVRHRVFTDWVRRCRPQWKLAEFIPNRYPFVPAASARSADAHRHGRNGDTSLADFFIYRKAPV